MIERDLLRQQWLKQYRAPGFYKNLVVNILLSITGLYFAFILVGLGLLFPVIAKEAAPEQAASDVLNGLIIYTGLGVLIFRYFMQSLNTVDQQPYQILPIKRSTLVNYVLLTPLLNPFNYISLLFFVPVSISIISKSYGVWGTCQFIFMNIFMIWFNVLFATWLKRKYESTLWGTLFIMLIAGGLFLLEYFKVFSLFDISKISLHFLLSKNFGIALILIFPLIAFALNKQYFNKNYYTEKFTRKVLSTRSRTGSNAFFERFGKVGEIIMLMIKLVWRNKRTKSTLTVSLLFLLYGFLGYSGLYDDSKGFMYFVAMIVAGNFMLMFSQWLISWNGSHFDSLMTKSIDAREYISAHYFLMLFLNVISFIITTPYFFFGKYVIFLQVSAFLFNSGVILPLCMIFATFNTKRLELNEGSAMNYQGTTYNNFIYVMIIMILPSIIIAVANKLGIANTVIWIYAVMGLIGIMFTKQLIDLCTQQFLRRKYALCEGFRKKEA